MSDSYDVVNVNVLGRDYPVKCTKSEAEELQEVESRINLQLNQYRLKYVQLDKQDCLSMALIENQMDSLPSKEETDYNECITILDRLEQLVSEHIS